MKKLMLIATVAIFVASCGTKESTMSTNSNDSSAVDASRTMSPATTDTMTTKAANPDSIKMKMDSANTVR